MATSMNANEWLILIVSFFFTFWQPTRFYSQRLWASEWWAIIRDHTDAVPRGVNRAIPAIWAILFATTATAWFYIWKSKEDLNAEYDVLMGLIVTTIVVIKLWVMLVALVPSQSTFVWASALVFAAATGTWIAMFVILDAGSRIGTIVLVLWAPLVAWTLLATGWLGLAIANTDYTMHDLDAAIARYETRGTYQKLK